MKQSRIDCQARIDDDVKKLYWVESEEKSLLSRYEPLVKQLEERKRQRAAIVKEMDDTHAAINDVRFTLHIVCHTLLIRCLLFIWS